MADIFISYKREDRERIVPLARALEARGYTVWWDLELVPSQKFERQVKRELDAARCVIVVWTERSIGDDAMYVSDWVQIEANSGDERGILLPVQFDPRRKHWRHGQSQFAALHGWNGDESAQGFVDLLRGVTLHAGSRERPVDRELATWQAAEQDETAEAFRQFLAEFPQSRFADIARGRAFELDELAAWLALGATPTLAALASYLRTYPAGRFANDAEAQIKEIERTSATREQPNPATTQVGSLEGEVAETELWVEEETQPAEDQRLEPEETNHFRRENTNPLPRDIGETGRSNGEPSAVRVYIDRLFPKRKVNQRSGGAVHDTSPSSRRKIIALVCITFVILGLVSGLALLEPERATKGITTHEGEITTREFESRHEVLRALLEYAGGQNIQLAATRPIERDGASMIMAASIAADYRETFGYGVLSDGALSDCVIESEFHSGLDLEAFEGAPVVATSQGVVSFAGQRSLYGLTAEIDHGHGFKTRYARLRDIQVQRGEQVAIGQRIGSMGSMAHGAATHALHYEVWFRGRAVDPVNFLRAGRHVHEQG